jgi:hypothetical protein
MKELLIKEVYLLLFVQYFFLKVDFRSNNLLHTDLILKAKELLLLLKDCVGLQELRVFHEDVIELLDANVNLL